MERVRMSAVANGYQPRWKAKGLVSLKSTSRMLTIASCNLLLSRINDNIRSSASTRHNACVVLSFDFGRC